MQHYEVVVFEFLDESCKSNTDFMDYTSILKSALLKWVTSWGLFVPGLQYETNENTSSVEEAEEDVRVFQAVDVIDARKREDLSFEKNGFTLIKLPEPTKTTNWYRYSRDLYQFENKMRDEIMQLYPNATRVLFGNHNVRGGQTFLHIPKIVNSPHLDYTQNDDVREEFFHKYPVSETMGKSLLGRLDTDDDEMRVMLGIWKPIGMSTPVCDYPLAVADAQSFSYGKERPLFVHIKVGPYTYHGASARPIYDMEQKWYYYSLQTGNEVMIFTQYSKGREFANYHTSFESPAECGKYDPRISAEMRAAVFFPKEN